MPGKFEERKEKACRLKQKIHKLTQKSDGEMQVFVGGISHHESKWLY